MLNNHQFEQFKVRSPFENHLSSFNKMPYKYPPTVKTREELDLMEAKARALNLKTTQQLYGYK